jgi:hypothetical protein
MSKASIFQSGVIPFDSPINYGSPLNTILQALVVYMIISTTIPQTADWMSGYIKQMVLILETVILTEKRGLTLKKILDDMREGVQKHHRSGKKFGVVIFFSGINSSYRLKENFFVFFKEFLNEILRNPPVELEPEKMMDSPPSILLAEPVSEPVTVAPPPSVVKIAVPIAVAPHPPPPQKRKIVIVYHYRKWNPPYKHILYENLENTEFEFDIQIYRMDVTPQKSNCGICRNTRPGCGDCQRDRRIAESSFAIDRLLMKAKMDAELEIENMMKNVKNFRYACNMFKKDMFKTLSFLYFLRIMPDSTRQVTFSHFDDFWGEMANFYPVSQHLKDAGMQCQIFDKDLMTYVKFPNSAERNYPEFGDVSTRNAFFALTMAMKMLNQLVSSNHESQCCKDRLVLKLHISNRIFSRIIGMRMKLIPPTPKK